LSVLADDPSTAEQRLMTFVQAWPDSPLAGDASLRLAEMAEARGDFDLALRRYYVVVRKFSRNNRIDAARLGVATLEHERGNQSAASRALAQIRLRRLSETELHRAHRLLADTEGDPVAKIDWLAALRASESEEVARAKIDEDIDELFAQLDPRTLTAIAKRVEPDIPAARALLMAAERALDSRDLRVARDHIERASRLPLDSSYASRLGLAADRLRLLEVGGSDIGVLPTFQDFDGAGPISTASAHGNIGVVLPLTGRFAPIGEETLRGILLAAGAFDAITPVKDRPNIRISIRDTGGSPTRAAEAVRDLALQESVSAIIGPLLSEECDAAAAVAEAYRVPLLALTTRPEVARDREFVFRLRTMPKDEMQILADYAMRVLGMQRFGILYPRDAYGLGLSNMFWTAVEERGGRIVALAAYDPAAVDFEEPIRRLIGWDLLTDQEKLAIEERDDLMRSARRLAPEEATLVREEARAMLGPGEELLPPIVDFDALFIPEAYDKVVLIAPQLAFHEATGATLLGTDAWNHPELVSIGRRHVEGALFTASFYPNSSVDYVSDFADRYEATYGSPADDLSAHAYDAVNLILVQLARGARSRSEVRDRILDIGAFPGVSGVLSMNADGNARKRPFLLGVQRGRIVEVE
jgi:ABC-type branched-subunit amino acid transport system substrate-binding protein/predicted negative regulator of RcsB-dependent stress response